MDLLYFAAIDVGSNAIRLLITQVIKQPFQDPLFRKVDLIRIPIRLGEDAFSHGYISQNKIEQLAKAMRAYKELIDIYQVKDYRAYATSAMRQAQNQAEVIAAVKNYSGLDLKVIDGSTESMLLYSTEVTKKIKKFTNFLYIDVGGGSTELSLFSQQQLIAAQSFQIGTVRLLTGQQHTQEWLMLDQWMEQHIPQHKNALTAIGSGGNINKLFKLTELKPTKPLAIEQLKNLYGKLVACSYEERITKFGLNPDRADVIVPAAEIFIKILTQAKINKIFVPKMGIADGMVQAMYQSYDLTH